MLFQTGHITIAIFFRKKIMLVRTLLSFLFCLSVSSVLSAESVSKKEEFAAINKEWTELIANLGALKSEYATSTDSARKAEIRKQYEPGLEKAKGLEGKVVAAAEAAYAEAPNSDPNVIQILLGTLYDKVGHDDYEPAFRVGKLLMDHKCASLDVPALAGVAAYCVNEYDLAGTWLRAAQESGPVKLPNGTTVANSFAKICQMMPKRHFANYPEMLELTKAGWDKEQKIREAEAKANDLPRVLLKTSAGDIEVELFENEAPNSVLNFITLVDKDFYKNVKFHRVLPGFMAQGGDPKGDGTGGPGYTIPDECKRPDHRLHFRGSLSMAHSSLPDSNGSQFYICFEPTTYLDGKHTVFGRVVRGMEVLAKLKRRDPEEETVGAADTILEAKVIRRRAHPYDAKDLKKSGNTD
jgi:cyclophilin family peptidyl-prolyl cis-trans isomerase